MFLYSTAISNTHDVVRLAQHACFDQGHGVNQGYHDAARVPLVHGFNFDLAYGLMLRTYAKFPHSAKDALIGFEEPEHKVFQPRRLMLRFFVTTRGDAYFTKWLLCNFALLQLKLALH